VRINTDKNHSKDATRARRNFNRKEKEMKGWVPTRQMTDVDRFAKALEKAKSDYETSVRAQKRAEDILIALEKEGIQDKAHIEARVIEAETLSLEYTLTARFLCDRILALNQQERREQGIDDECMGQGMQERSVDD